MSTQADRRKGWLKAGTSDFKGGMDSNLPNSSIAPDQVAFAVNCTMRGGKIRPRPGMVPRPIAWDGSIQTAFETGKFQHAAFFDGTEDPSLMVAISGKVYKIRISNWHAQDITPDGGNSPLRPQGWSVQAENYWVYQDNSSQPIIFDGSSARRADPAQREVPVGNCMAYTMGRLVVALPDRQRFRIGDLVFGSSGNPALQYRDAMLHFTENDYLNEGGDMIARIFGAPSGYGPITSMKAVAMCDTALGQGPLLIGTPNVIFTVQMPFDRTTWDNLANPLQTASPINGPMSQGATVLVNTDLWYRSIDGIRSYIMARRDFTAWGNTPMSNEIEDLLSYDTERLLGYSSAVLFDNRLLTTVSPVSSPSGVYHRGLVALDFNLASGLRYKANPAWEGVWTGLKVLQILTGMVDNKPRCFMFIVNSSNKIQVWELTLDDKFDDTDGRISWSYDSRAYDFNDSEQFKKLQGGRLVATELTGRLEGTIKYRSDDSPCWQSWDTFDVCSTYTQCTVGCTVPTFPREQQRTPIRLWEPADTFDAINGRKYRTGYSFQVRHELQGYAQIDRTEYYASDEPESISRDRKTPL